MSEPYLSEIKMFGFSWAPRNWALCDGALMPVDENQALYALLGPRFGGDGRSTFAVPDLRGRTPVHMGNGVSLAESYGAEEVTLVSSQLPVHNHNIVATTDVGSSPSYADGYFATCTGGYVYGRNENLVTLGSQTVSDTGGGQPHNNMQPSLVISFCIAISGAFPTRN